MDRRKEKDVASNKLSKHNTRNGKFKQKTRESTKQWKEEKTKAFWEKRAKSKEKKCPTINQQKATPEIKKKEINDYGYFLWRNEPC